MDKAAVAFVDILGFKGIWQRRDSNQVLDILKGVKKRITTNYKHPAIDQVWPVSSEPEVTVLSDTIVIAIKSDEPHCVLLMANIINNISLYFYEFGLFFRGAISYGEYEQEDSTFIGPAIDDVAGWYEVADWIGTILTPTTNYIYDRFKNVTVGVNKIPVTPYIKYTVPGKGGRSFKLNCLNWPAYLQASYKRITKSNEKSDARALFEKMFSEQAAFDASVLLKYENTLDFIDYSVSQMNETDKISLTMGSS